MEKNILLEKGKKSIEKFFLLKPLIKMKLMKMNIINNNDNRISMINKINNNIKKRKIRNAGIDLVRILSMYAIIIHHILYFGNLFIKYNKYKELVLMNISCFWHVSSYALISGYIGYKSNKYSNLLYLWICTLFYSLSIKYFFDKKNIKMNIGKTQITDFFPVTYEKHWYFTKYFGMYLFLPVVNKGIESMTRAELRIVVISLILICILLKDILNPKKDIYYMKGGCSILWLLIYYLTGVYFGKFKKDVNGIKKIILSIIYAFIFYFSTYVCYFFSNFTLDNSKGYFTMKAIKILKTLLLTQINYNKYLSKITTFFGPLTFGVYLIHTDRIILKNI